MTVGGVFCSIKSVITQYETQEIDRWHTMYFTQNVAAPTVTVGDKRAVVKVGAKLARRVGDKAAAAAGLADYLADEEDAQEKES